ncbi:hypothetical protein TNIN_219561 [Trichonephila inaurata madagascariensis]|uniref:Uncharacterized protein n=1 Tax=Trichonephila inaurata madagascariensis TaxID=2747483 RepID=A0A8X6XY76_9ARAC|nr:hypothetical protein TNIN_219561 [Trichonephila inaurata madagascariensis]
MCEEFWGLEGSSLDRKEFFGFSRSSWCKSLPRSLSPDERCTRALMAQFQSPVYVQQVGYGDTDPCNCSSTSKASPAPPRTSPVHTETMTQYGRRVKFRLPISSRQPPSTDSEEE